MPRRDQTSRPISGQRDLFTGEPEWRCLACGRRLTDPASVAAKLGPTCRTKSRTKSPSPPSRRTVP